MPLPGSALYHYYGNVETEDNNRDEGMMREGGSNTEAIMGG